MPDDGVKLPDEHRAKLDELVSRMEANNETDDAIRAVVDDFKNKYGVKKKEPLQSPSLLQSASSSTESLSGTGASVPGGIDYLHGGNQVDLPSVTPSIAPVVTGDGQAPPPAIPTEGDLSLRAAASPATTTAKDQNLYDPTIRTKTNEFGEAALRGTVRLGNSIMKSPAFLYDIASTVANELVYDPINAVTGNAFGRLPSSAEIGKNIPEESNITGSLDDALARGSEDQAKKYDKEINEYLLGKDKDVEKGLKLLALQITESAPTTIALMLGNAASLSSAQIGIGGGVVFGSDKMSQIEKESEEARVALESGQFSTDEEKSALEEKVNLPQFVKTTNALATGLFEGFFETYGLTKLGGYLKDIVKGGGKAAKDIAEKSFREVYGPLAKKYLGVMAEEALSEGATQFSENVIDKYSGVDPNTDLRQGVADAMLVGLGSAKIMTTPVAAIDLVVTASNRKEAIRLSEEKKALEDDLEIASNNQTKAALAKKIRDINELEANLVEAEKEMIAGLSPEAKKDISALQEKANEVASATVDPEISDDTKEIFKKDLEKIDAAVDDVIKKDAEAAKELTSEIFTTNSGYQIKRYKDRDGNVVKEEFFDMDGKPIGQGVALADVTDELNYLMGFENEGVGLNEQEYSRLLDLEKQVPQKEPETGAAPQKSETDTKLEQNRKDYREGKIGYLTMRENKESISIEPEIKSEEPSVEEGPEYLKPVSVMITPATLRSRDPETARISALTKRYDEVLRELTTSPTPELIAEKQALDRQILEEAKQDIISRVAEVDGLEVSFGEDKVGSWEGNFEPSLGMTLKIGSKTDTKAASDILYDFAERYSQDAFILDSKSEDDAGFQAGTKPAPFGEERDGWVHSPQIMLKFDSGITPEQTAKVTKSLKDSGIKGFTIDKNGLTIIPDFSLSDEQKALSLEEQETVKDNEYDRIRKAAEQVKKDVLGDDGRLEISIRRILQKHSRSDSGGEGSVERKYDRSDLFKGIATEISVAEGQGIELSSLRNKEIELQKEGKNLTEEESLKLSELSKKVIPALEETFEAKKESYEESNKEVVAIAESEMKDSDGFVATAPLKKPARAAVKTARWYSAITGMLGDGARVSLVVTNNKEAESIFKRILKKKNPEDSSVRSEKVDTEFGYPKRLVEVRTSNGLVAEVQVITTEAFLAKEGTKNIDGEGKKKADRVLAKVRSRLGWNIPEGVGHYLYEIGRDLNVPKNIRDKAVKLSKEYYDAFINDKSTLSEEKFRNDISEFKKVVDGQNKTSWDPGNTAVSPKTLNDFIKNKVVEEKKQPLTGDADSVISDDEVQDEGPKEDQESLNKLDTDLEILKKMSKRDLVEKKFAAIIERAWKMKNDGKISRQTWTQFKNKAQDVLGGKLNLDREELKLKSTDYFNKLKKNLVGEGYKKITFSTIVPITPKTVADLLDLANSFVHRGIDAGFTLAEATKKALNVIKNHPVYKRLVKSGELNEQEFDDAVVEASKVKKPKKKEAPPKKESGDIFGEERKKATVARQESSKTFEKVVNEMTEDDKFYHSIKENSVEPHIKEILDRVQRENGLEDLAGAILDGNNPFHEKIQHVAAFLVGERLAIIAESEGNLLQKSAAAKLSAKLMVYRNSAVNVSATQTAMENIIARRLPMSIAGLHNYAVAAVSNMQDSHLTPQQKTEIKSAVADINELMETEAVKAKIREAVDAEVNRIADEINGKEWTSKVTKALSSLKIDLKDC